MKKAIVETLCIAGGNASSPGILRNVRICGLESRNPGDGGEGRRYLPDSLRNAVHLYEGAEVYIDHDPHAPVRAMLSKFGKLTGVHYVEGKGLFGDLKYNPRHIYADTFEGWVETDPGAIGFSHAAKVAYEMRDGVETITEILGVKSVDIVSSPGTTKGLLESVSMDEQVMPDIAPPAPPPAAPPPACDDEGKTQEDYLADMIGALIRDPALSGADKMAKIKKCLKLLDDGPEMPDADIDEDEEADAEEAAPEEKDEAPPEKTEKDEEEAFAAFASKFDDHIAKVVAGLLVKTVGESAAKEKAKAGAKAPVSTPAPVKKALTVDDLCESIWENK